MQEGRAAHLADLAVAEEAAQRHLPDLRAEEIGVVVGAPEQVGAPAQAGEGQRVTISGLPMGRHPWATMVSTARFPESATPATPRRNIFAPRKSRFAPGAEPPLASPPNLLAAG